MKVHYGKIGSLTNGAINSSTVTNGASLQDIIGAVDLVSLVGSYIDLDKNGKAKCPFHKENSASFIAREKNDRYDKDHYHCFGCGAHGDALSFVMNYNNIDFHEGLLELSKITGKTIQWNHNRDHEKEKKNAIIRKKTSELLVQQEKLKTNDLTAALYKKGIDLNLAKEKRVSYLPAGKYPTLTTSMPGLIFPVLDWQKKEVGYLFESLDGTVVTPIGLSSSMIYGRENIAKDDDIIVTSRPSEALSLSRNNNAICIPIDESKPADLDKRLAIASRLAPNLTFFFNQNDHDEELGWLLASRLLRTMTAKTHHRIIFTNNIDIITRGANAVNKLHQAAYSISDYLIAHIEEQLIEASEKKAMPITPTIISDAIQIYTSKMKAGLYTDMFQEYAEKELINLFFSELSPTPS